MPEPSARMIAATVLKRVVKDRAFSPISLHHAFRQNKLELRDRAFVTHLVYGTLTYLGAINEVLEQLILNGLASIPPILRAILRIALYELYYHEKATPHAAVNEAVQNTLDCLGRRFSGLTNGVLRRFLREKELFFVHKEDPILRLSQDKGLPTWLAKRLLEQLDETSANAMMDFLNAPIPTHFRLRKNITVPEMMDSLQSEGLKPALHSHVKGAFQTTGAIATSTLHRQQKIAIQDAGALASLSLLPASIQGPILDACAGQGGKTLSLLDLYPKNEVISTDLHLKKLHRIQLSKKEQERHSLIQWDMKKSPPKELTESAPFRTVVLDAPCSAFGTIGRHPEARWNRSQKDVEKLASLQTIMLDQIAPLVAVDGVLLYIVCTWTKEESSEQIDSFLKRNSSFKLDNSGDLPAIKRFWPHTDHTECFFVARLRRENISQ